MVVFPVQAAAFTRPAALDEDAHTVMCTRNDPAADLLAEFSMAETGETV